MLKNFTKKVFKKSLKFCEKKCLRKKHNSLGRYQNSGKMRKIDKKNVFEKKVKKNMKKT